MDYELLESDITARLVPLVASFEVKKLPESQEEYQRPFSIGRVSVVYAGSKFSELDDRNPLRSIGQVVQNEILKIEILVQAKRLRGPKGCFPIWQDLKTLLLGFRPSHCDKIYAKDFEYVGFDQAAQVWTYKACFETTTLSVQDEWDEEGGAPLSTVEFNQTIITNDGSGL